MLRRLRMRTALLREISGAVTQKQPNSAGKRVVLATYGSLGDFHPYLALALELHARGHRPVIAANSSHRDIVKREGIEFRSVRPYIGQLRREFGGEAALTQRGWDPQTGPKFLISRVLMPSLAASYADLSAVCEDADLLVSHPLTLTAPLVAEKFGVGVLSWASVALTPSVLMSAYDPPVLAPAPFLINLRVFGPRVYAVLLRAIKSTTESWIKPWRRFRRELGLSAKAGNPLFDGQFSPQMTLALFSRVLASPQPDWPAHTMITGFPFYDRRGDGKQLEPALAAFLEAGEAPIIFTLGPSVVMNAGDFYQESIAAATALGKRAVLLIGRDPRNRPSSPFPNNIAVFEYAPYSLLLPRAAAVVHQGGVGTTAQALRAGVPMLVVPFGYDQPDNAARVVRLGVARTVARARYNGVVAASELTALLTNPNYARRAGEVAIKVRAEDGASTACNAIETLLAS